MNKLMSVVGTLPTTNLSWCLAWLLVFLEQGHYYWTGVPPDGEWLVFVGGIFGAVVVQHGVKRFSYQPTPPGTLDREDAPAANGAAVEEYVSSEEEQEP